ncbi:MAG: tetratricopeptide repeat protein [Leptospiraceae bacterium]|nr:tetratricopeptide repeat protein [Leptospiraceae bacterium]MDW8305652.1 tetratricopeptide repeat protein [Leptospiraceae bacterium]
MRNGLFWLVFPLMGMAQDLSQELENAEPPYIDQIYEKALLSYVEGNYEKSLQYIRHVIKSNFNDYRLRLLAGYNHWHLGNVVPATIHLLELEKINKEEPLSYSEPAALYLSQNEIKKAEKILLKGLDQLEVKNKVSPRMYNLLARALLLQGREGEALRYIEKAKAVFKSGEHQLRDRVESLSLEGWIYALRGQYDKALFVLEWAADQEKQDPYLYNLLGQIYWLWAENLPREEANEMRAKARTAWQNALALNAPPELKELIQKKLNSP